MKDFLRSVVYAGIFVSPFIVLIIANSLFFPFITGKNFAFRAVVEIIFAAWIILAIYEPMYRPRFSWISVTFLGLIVVMFFANLFGEYPLKSFWSNFERMEGYVTLVHAFMYFIVIGSMLTTEKLWNRFFNTTLAAAVILMIYAFAQLSGSITINQGGWRLDGTLGNSAYMAIYMLFHIFIAMLMFARTQSKNLRYVYGALILVFIFLLLQTATRGTIFGFAGGTLLAVTYVALFAKGYPQVRKIASGGLIALVIFVGLFVVFKDSSLVQENRHLKRVADTSLSDATTRFDIWGMAIEGVKERPLLGWGQGNFNYVFNKFYRPALHSQEPWFDRVHDIVLDWLVAGGIIGALFYFSIIGSAIYYIFFRPIFSKEEDPISVIQRGLLLGLLAGYVFHNLFVFDNIVSYIFYGVLLAFIHSHYSKEVPQIMAWNIRPQVVEQIITPIVGVVLIVTLYFVNVPGYLAAGDIIDAFRTADPNIRLAEFDEALSRKSFGNQEIREQLTQQTLSMLRAPQISDEIKQQIFRRTEQELLAQAEEKPGDARVHVFISSFYRSTNNLDQAADQLKIARSLSPRKQQIIFEQGLTELQKQDFDAALGFFKEAYDLAPEYEQARIFYGVGALYAGRPEIVGEVINTDRLKIQFARSDLAVQAVYAARNYNILKDMFTTRIEAQPNDPQSRVNLAVAYYETDDIETAVEILEQAIADIPSFKTQGEGFIADLRAGRAPGQANQPAVNVGGQQVPVHTQ